MICCLKHFTAGSLRDCQVLIYFVFMAGYFHDLPKNSKIHKNYQLAKNTRYTVFKEQKTTLKQQSYSDNICGQQQWPQVYNLKVEIFGRPNAREFCKIGFRMHFISRFRNKSLKRLLKFISHLFNFLNQMSFGKNNNFSPFPLWQ